MLLIDTHAHLYSKQYSSDREEMLQRAIAADVKYIFLPAIDSKSHTNLLALEAAHPETCFAMMGLHPCSVEANFEEELTLVKSYLDKRHFCAVGEIGLDYYHSLDFVPQQKIAFRTQIGWARDLNVPIDIHARDSVDDILAILKEEKTDERVRGIFHCFTGDARQAQEAIELGFALGIGGVLTYKNSGMDAIFKDIPLEHLILETDAPYLTPVPFRGKRNESAYIYHIAQRLAEVKNVSLKEIADATSYNALKIFGKEALWTGN